MIMGLLALLAVAGVFFIAAYAIGALQILGARCTQRSHQEPWPTVPSKASSPSRIPDAFVYANEAFMAFAGARDASDLKTVERLFVGAPEVSEANLSPVAGGARASGAGRGRSGSRPHWLVARISAGTGSGCARSPAPAVPRRCCGAWPTLPHERERHENVFQELQHAIDYLDHAPAGFFSVEPDGSIAYINATLAAWLGQ